MNSTSHPLTRRSIAVATTALLGLGAVACSSDSSTAEGVPINVADSTEVTITDDSTAVVTTVPVTTLPATTLPDEIVETALDVADNSSVAATLTDDEIAGLLWMREEEQLAHDVYVTLGDLWGMRIFENIASSESTHVAATIDVLDQYGIDDPAAGNDLGTFTNPQIQALYDQLVADGSESMVAALEVGALIEELDISDLQLQAAATDVADINTLYANLEKGSRNHLRAFTSQLEDRGVSYEPTQVDPDIYEAIVSSPTERGPDA